MFALNVGIYPKRAAKQDIGAKLAGCPVMGFIWYHLFELYLNYLYIELNLFVGYSLLSYIVRSC